MIYRISQNFNSFFIQLMLLFSIPVLSYSETGNENTEVQELLQVLDTARGSGKVTALNKLFIATYYADPMLAFKYGTEALATAREVRDEKGRAYSHNNLGIFFLDRGNYPAALEQFLEAEKIRESRRDTAGLADVFLNLGMLYQYQELYPNAMNYYHKALEIYLHANDSVSAGLTLNNIGNAWYAFHKSDSALKYLNLALIYKASDEYNLPSTLNNLGQVYLRSGDLRLAEAYFNRALRMRRESGNLFGEAESLLSLADLEFTRGKSQAAIQYGLEGYTLASRIGSSEILPEASRLISRAYYTSGKLKEAYEWMEQYLHLKDSLYDAEILTRIAGLEAAGKIKNQKVEIDLLKSQNQLAQVEADRRKLLLWASVSGILLLITLAVVLFSRYRSKKRDHKLLQVRNQLIEDKNLLISRQNQLITDSIRYARNIQESFLPAVQMPPLSGAEMFLIHIPRDIVSGDFYWIDYANGKTLVAIADGTGHGVPGAFISLIGITLIKTSIRELPTISPDQRLAWLNQEVIKALGNQARQDDFSEGMDIALISYDHATRKLEFSGAQRPLILFRKNGMEVIKGDRISIGEKRIQNPVFTLHTFEIEPGDALYLFTDGMTDLLGGPKKRRITTPVFLKWLEEIQALPDDLRESELLFRIQNWRKDAPQADDMLLAGIEFHG